MDKICGTCAYYARTNLHGIVCEKTMKPAGYLQQKDCWTDTKTDPEASLVRAPENKPSKKPGRPRKSKDTEAPAKVKAPAGPTKRCSHCGLDLPITDFNHHSHTKDGLQYICRKCQSEMAVEAARKRREKARKEKMMAIMGDDTSHTYNEWMHLMKTSPKLRDEVIALLPPDCAPKVEVHKEIVKKVVVPMELADVDSSELIEELRKRGWHGTLSKELINL